MSEAALLRCLCPALLVGWLLLEPAVGTAQSDEAAQPAQTTSATANETVPEADEQAIEEVETPFTPPEEEAQPEARDKCDWPVQGKPLQEQAQEVVRSLSCHTFRWFDGLFGDTYDFDEEGVNGLLSFGAEQTQYYGFDPSLRLRVRAKLPNMSRRWDLLLGRMDEERYVSDTQAQDSTFYNPGVIERTENPSWLLGLGHHGKEFRAGWDYSVGVRLNLPPRLYAKAQWYYNKIFSDKSDLRFRQTFFWRGDYGFGTTSRGDLAYSIDPRNVLRWEGIGTIHQETEGVQWYFGQTWYHLFSGSAAISLLAFVNGETGAEVPLQEYGLKLIWRRPFTRDWLYLSIGPSITWPREYEYQQREASLGFGVWMEMEFGDWHW